MSLYQSTGDSCSYAMALAWDWVNPHTFPSLTRRLREEADVIGVMCFFFFLQLTVGVNQHKLGEEKVPNLKKKKRFRKKNISSKETIVATVVCLSSFLLLASITPLSTTKSPSTTK